MRVATWNVNSARAREERLLAWLDRHEPDLLCLQELKGLEDRFPVDPVREAGYEAAILGQKTYNGVAILSRAPLDDVRRGFSEGPEDPQARLISARSGGLRIYSAYFPNGSEVGSDKYEYKLEWIDRLLVQIEKDHDPGEPLLLCGDFNIAPEGRDLAEPQEWEGSVLFNPDMRERFQRFLAWGLTDTFRLHNEDEEGVYSWWDYRGLAFPRNHGARIDHILATSPLAGACTGAWIDRDERKGKKPSDHAPMVVELGPWG